MKVAPKNRTHKKLKGFTITELLIVLVLTSLSIIFSYGTLNYIQKIFSDYKKQNRFLNEFTVFKSRMDMESIKSISVIEQKESTFEIRRDSSLIVLQLNEEVILLKKEGACDTFHIAAKKISKEYELMKNPAWTNKLLSKLEFETEFSKQKFFFSFNKEHSASFKLALENSGGWQL
ncbi:hypothetical protein CNR22_00155 [Sphingobacteriaceae bacterium]|nr:hypothetical protein CNR22_00155 [Sphingobacteriaceae bacterium]